MICPRDFVSSEDGNDFITKLEGVSECYSAVFGIGDVRPEEVETFLAVVHPNLEAVVYVNEIRPCATVRVNRVGPDGIKKGELVAYDDVADIEELRLSDAKGSPISIPADAGYSLILSHRWRKGLCFDYSVFGPHARPRTENLARLWGHCYARLVFQEMYSITDSQWNQLLEWGWFPFIGLKHGERCSLLSWAKMGRFPGPILEECCKRFATTLYDRMEGWRRHEHLTPHMEFLTRAKERYDAQDWLSCIHLLYPQIEGVMRRVFAEENPNGSVNQESLVANLVENHLIGSVLLPNRFEEFLAKVYFRAFQLPAGNVRLSRHSLAHGVSCPKDYDLLTATVGFLTVDQLAHYLSD